MQNRMLKYKIIFFCTIQAETDKMALPTDRSQLRRSIKSYIIDIIKEASQKLCAKIVTFRLIRKSLTNHLLV